MIVEYITLSFLCEYYNILQALTKKKKTKTKAIVVTENTVVAI